MAKKEVKGLVKLVVPAKQANPFTSFFAIFHSVFFRLCRGTIWRIYHGLL